MRLHRLELRRYGHLSDVVLDFPVDAALCVVHGVNEAGKSTALAAIADALFGFQDVRTGPRPDFLHGGPQLRLGVTLTAQDGRRASLVRRKGRTNTLTDEAGEPVAELVMQRMLGGAGRDAWKDTFGLNGERLREGGRALAAGGGTVGESLFSAATGMLHHRAALDRLDEAAKALVGRTNANRTMSAAVERWRVAQREMERASVQPRAWIEADDAHSKAVANLVRLQGQVEALRRAETQLQRMRRTAPLLALLDAARGTAVRLATTPHLSPDAEARLKADLAARDNAQIDTAQETRRAEALVARRDALVRSLAIIAAQDNIAHLTEQRVSVINAEAELPDVAVNAKLLRDKVAEAASELGGLSPEAARDTVPPAKARAKVLQVAKRHSELATTIATARRVRDDVQAVLATAQRDLAAAPAPAEVGPLRKTLDTALQEGRLDTELAGMAAIALAARGAAITALNALSRWTGTLEGLASCKLPLSADEAAAAGVFGDAASTVVQTEAALARAEQESRDATALRDSFGPPATVPTLHVVNAARAVRDSVWRTIRVVVDGGPLPSAPQTIAAEFEQAQTEADRLADGRADEAQRVSEYMNAIQRVDVAQHGYAGCLQPLADAQEGHLQAAARWRALWCSVMDEPGPPAAMLEWRRERAAVLDGAKKAAEAEAARDDVLRRRAASIASLRHFLPRLEDEIGLARAVAEARAELDVREAATAVHRTLTQAPGLAQIALDQAEQAVRRAGEAQERWQSDWTPAVIALGLTAGCSVDDAETAVAAWAVIDNHAPRWRTDELRVAQMTRAIDDFGRAVTAAASAGSPRPAGEPALATAARLARELDTARAVETQHASLSLQMAERRQDAVAAQERHDRAAARIAALQREAGVSDLPGLEAVISDARQRSEAEASAVDLAAKLLTEGDGHDEATLRQAAATYDPDAAPAQLAMIGAELVKFDSEREQLTAERTRRETELAIMNQAGTAAEAAQDARHALVEATAAAERYGRLVLARELLRAGMAQFRQSQQGPLLEAAGRHFAALTAGRYERLTVDEDNEGRMLLLARRDDRSECPVGALSEGTQDQLFLALRIAMVEAHAASSEPLPFIADDLLVHFDDERATAAIRLLADLGRTTQVILFSHHDHVAAIASRMGTSEVAIVRMPAIGSDPSSSRLAMATT